MKCSRVEGTAACIEPLLGRVRELAGNYFIFWENSGRHGAARSKRVPLGLSQMRVGGEACGVPRGGDSPSTATESETRGRRHPEV